MIDIDSCKGSLSPKKFFQWCKYKLGFYKEHPLYFRPDGLTIFVGAQGTGKTLSAVCYVYKLLELYPNALIVTNLSLRDFPFDNERVFPFNNADDLKNYTNGEKGVIFLIDEIQLYFNSLESKNINPEVMVQISQQRKQRKHIVATSQVFGRMGKALREQFNTVIVCKNYLGFLQVNKLVDRDSVEESSGSQELKGKVRKKFIWFHSPDLYGRYDTYYVIDRNKFINNEEKKVNIYDSTQLSSDN